MSVLSGYDKYKRYLKTSSGYKLISQWTNSNTVEFDDGKTAQTKLGAIDGITDSLASTSSNVALSAAAGKSLQDQCTALNGNLNSKSNIGHTHDDRYQKLLVREKQSFSITVSPQGNTSYEKVFTKTGYTPIITVATLGSYGDKASLNQAWDIASGYAKCYGYVGYWGTDSNCNIWVEIQILWVKN